MRVGNTLVRIEALGPTSIRLRYAPDGSLSDRSFAVVSESGFSAPDVKIRNTADMLELDTGQLRVRVAKSPFRVAFLSPEGQIISEDAANSPVAWAGRQFRVCKTMPEDEHYFGLGDKAGPLDHRSQAFVLWNTDSFAWQESTDPLYKSIPFFLGMRTGKAYGIFLDNTYRSSFDFGKETRNVYCFGAEDGQLNYYFFYGPDPKRVIEQYTSLTGRPPLPPLFAFGYAQSRWSYFPEARVRELAGEFRRRQIPADVIYLDIDYEDGYRSFTVDQQKFPHFEEMIQDLREQGFKIVVIADPHLKQDSAYRPYEEALARDYLVHNPDGSVYVGNVWPGPSVFPDFARSDVRRWWGTLYSGFTKAGIRGFWDDMNEPAVFPSSSNHTKTLPLATIHHVDGRATDHREIHNVYGMENARATYEGLLQLQPNLRPFVLTRAAYAGTQRFAASWTGDTLSTWNHLRLSVPTLLNLGISGYAFVGDDIGGFYGSPSPELLTRWMELGAFNPLYRNHAHKDSEDREPWAQGPQHEEIRRRFIELRYRLLPYIYTSAEEATRTGIPIMRPMFLEFPDNAATISMESEFMFGHDLLVAPKVVETLDSYQVVLPQGPWYDYWTGQKLDGGQTLTVNPRLDEVPVYVRGGSIIPHQPKVQNVDQIPDGPLELRVYPGPNCTGSVYLDDGSTLDFMRGSYARGTFSCEILPDSLRIKVALGSGNFKPWWNEIGVTVFGVLYKPREVIVNGMPRADWKYADSTFSTSVPVTGKPIEILISR